MKYQVGIVGAGSISREHSITLSRLREVGGLSVFDPDVGAAAKLAEACGARPAKSLKALVMGCDVVWICTPPFARKEAISCAAAAGKAIFCEKPLALTRKDCREYRKLVEKAKIPFFFGQSGRFAAFGKKMKALVESGAVGPPVKIWSTRQGWLDPKLAPAWRLDDERGGGTVIELGIHEIDFIRWVGGNVQKLFAVASNRSLIPGKFQDSLVAVGTMDHGVIAHFDISWANPRYLWQRGVDGEEGSLFFDDARVTEVTLLRAGKAPRIFTVETWQDPVTKENQALRDQAKAVFRALTRGEQPPVTFEDGVDGLEVALAMKKSAATGKICRPFQSRGGRS